jgi:predicted ArsR family transcriptional regulator
MFRNMADETVHPNTVVLKDARALRAYAHPLRLRLVGMLRREGPMTATRAGEALGESAASCSFHLRQLAKWGLVEEAGGGRGRERPWKATAQFTSWSSVDADADVTAASDLLTSMLVDGYVEQINGWIEQRAGEPAEWQEAAAFGDAMLYLTADELAEVKRALWDIGKRYMDRLGDPSLRPEGARQVTMLNLAFPTPPEKQPQQP